MSTAMTRLEPFGLEISGATGESLVDQAAADDALRLLDEHGVLVYRDLHISDEDLVAFSRLLGEVITAKTGEHAFPEIATITLDPSKTNATLAQYRRGNFLWHIDGATDELPQRATLLAAREVDEAGGDTEFANTFLAYDALPDDLKERIDGLQVRHSFAAAQSRANPDASGEERATWDRISSRRHPLVWTRGTGRKSLLLGATAAEVISLNDEEGASVLNQLLEWATQRRFILRHRWQRGDLVIWDNTGMLHRALPFEPTSRRLMHRTTLAGVEAVA